MIPEPQLPGALGALNSILVQLRSMAYEGVDHRVLADYLDVAEYLPQLMASREDRTVELRGALVDLVKRSWKFQTALDRFDDPTQIWCGP